jgi:hypothetical protein
LAYWREAMIAASRAASSDISPRRCAISSGAPMALREPPALSQRGRLARDLLQRALPPASVETALDPVVQPVALGVEHDGIRRVERQERRARLRLPRRDRPPGAAQDLPRATQAGGVLDVDPRHGLGVMGAKP